MSFLQPLLLFALPLALLPVIIHLIHLHRRRTVPWAAMMFLHAAQRMNRGYSRLRRLLILLFRVLAIAALLMMAARPLAGGWLGLTGGAPDTAIILLDRSASMEQKNLTTGLSKREAGLKQLTDGVRDAYRGRTRLVLIDSADGTPHTVEKPEALTELPATWATDTAADVPTMMQGALDYITANQTGRTDVWLLSDLQPGDWDASGGRWAALRQAFTELQGVRFHLLCYPQTAADNLAVVVESVERRESTDKAEIVLDLEIARTTPTAAGASSAASELPIRFVINGVTSVHPATLRDDHITLRGHSIPIDPGLKRGWGRVELPADSFASDNVWHFVFDERPVLKTTIITGDPLSMAPVRAALEAPSDPNRKYESTILSADRAAEIPWEETALIVWQAPIPDPEDPVARQLESHVAAGRSLLFLPPETAGDSVFMGLGWGEWQTTATESGAPELIDWWRSDTGLLANTRDGTALPVGETGVLRLREIVAGAEGEDQAKKALPLPLARMEDNTPLLIRAGSGNAEAASSRGPVHFLATLPGTDASTLARDGVVLYALLHRSLDAGAGSLGKARQRFAGAGVLGGEEENAEQPWKRIGEAENAGDAEKDDAAEKFVSSLLPLRAGVLASGDRLTALNRPLSEDSPVRLPTSTADELFAGLDHHIVEETLESESSLASEIWRTFLFLMAAALILEALFSMPDKRQPSADPAKAAGAPNTSTQSTA